MYQVANGIFACQKTFLEDSTWKDVPWEDDLPAKTPFDYLVDVLSDIPSYLQQVTCNFNNPTTATPQGVQQNDLAVLQEKLLDHLKAVKSLKETWNVKYSDPIWPVSPKGISPTSSENHLNPIEPPFQTALYFTDMQRAYDFCIYNVALILLIMLYDRVSNDLDPRSPYPGAALQTLLPRMSLQSIIQDICRCTEYMLLDIHGSRGYIVLMFPATVAYLASEKHSSEAKWLRDVCSRNADSSGFGFGEFALDQITPLKLWMDYCKKRR